MWGGGFGGRGQAALYVEPGLADWNQTSRPVQARWRKEEEGGSVSRLFFLEATLPELGLEVLGPVLAEPPEEDGCLPVPRTQKKRMDPFCTLGDVGNGRAAVRRDVCRSKMTFFTSVSPLLGHISASRRLGFKRLSGARDRAARDRNVGSLQPPSCS